jgi:eukaryotic-like serine/threonine-protein kinase
VARGRDYYGKYRLVRLIRAGHTCNVWETVNDDDGKRYALKILKAEERDNKLEIATLRHEHEVAHGMKHPNIIRVYEFNTELDIPYLVMEMFNATNLKILLRQGSERLFPIVKEVVDQAAEALYYFHEKGWIHRDVKPDNFLVSETGTVKLIDFAIAIRPVTGLAKLTYGWFATVQGTRSYMSPEQIRNQALDARSDVYSFGCVLHELVTGRAPFTGDSPNDLLNKHLTAPPPSAQVLSPNVSTEFSDLMRRMMAKKRDDRPANMWEFLKIFRQLRLFKVLPKTNKLEERAD